MVMTGQVLADQIQAFETAHPGAAVEIRTKADSGAGGHCRIAYGWLVLVRLYQMIAFWLRRCSGTNLPM